MTHHPAKPNIGRAAWREYVRAQLLAEGVIVEVLPSGLTRVSTQYDFITTTDLATFTERSLHRVLTRSN